MSDGALLMKIVLLTLGCMARVWNFDHGPLRGGAGD